RAAQAHAGWRFRLHRRTEYQLGTKTDLRIPIRGSKRNGNLRVLASRSSTPDELLLTRDSLSMARRRLSPEDARGSPRPARYFPTGCESSEAHDQFWKDDPLSRT